MCARLASTPVLHAPHVLLPKNAEPARALTGSWGDLIHGGMTDPPDKLTMPALVEYAALRRDAYAQEPHRLHMNSHDVERLLQSALPGGPWVIRKPNAGMAKESYVASRGEQRVFVKLDMSPRGLQRLAEIGVTPALLGSGEYHGRPYVLQEHIAGTNPDWQWFSGHLVDLARVIKRYQVDEELSSVLTPSVPLTYHQHVLQDLANLEAGLRAAVTPALLNPLVQQAFQELARQASQLPVAPLVPTHNDPNKKNWLLAGDRIYIVDWDDVVLSDPLRDVGLLLWWYVPETSWAEFFTAYGQPLDESTLQRLYWWSARASLRIALWFDRKPDPAMATEFATDFLAVLHRRPNPHAPFNLVVEGRGGI